MTRLMAADLAPKVRVNGIAVGSIATSRARNRAGRRRDPRRNGAAHAAEAARRPEDIARCALYLASPAASFVTGKLMEIDGGLEEANLEMGLPDL